MTKEYPDYFHPKTFELKLVWEFYAKAVLPPNVSDIQYNETKTAFFAGFLECFKIFAEYSAKFDENEVIELFERLKAEGDQFFTLMVLKHGAIK